MINEKLLSNYSCNLIKKLMIIDINLSLKKYKQDPI